MMTTYHLLQLLSQLYFKGLWQDFVQFLCQTQKLFHFMVVRAGLDQEKIERSDLKKEKKKKYVGF